MAERFGGAAPMVVFMVVGLAGIAGLAWWVMASGPRPTPISDAAVSAFAVPMADDEAGLRALLKNPAVVSRGRVVFNGLCLTCHGVHGEGTTLGPNLRDDYWLNGSAMSDLLRVINEGKPGTAMQPMRYTYSAADLAAVAAYIVTLKGNTEGSSKAAEGELKPITYWP